MFTQASWIQLWACWLAMTIAIAVFLYYALTSEESSAKQAFLPGKTTHGHYQIELACHTCHTPMMGVKQNACLDCHQEELKLAKDTHPAKKFNDPTNADRLAILDVQNCITCHREHVPHLTHNMGLSLPTDYCFHCHQDVAEQRPSHAGMEHNTCATAGCHNYHDNTALYEKFLDQHAGEPDHLDEQELPALSSLERIATAISEGKSLKLSQADHPAKEPVADEVLKDWHGSAHARAGVNCTHCHQPKQDVAWNNAVDHETCRTCHEKETEGFLQGRHGMRLDLGFSPLKPSMARHAMKSDAHHKSLTCNSCHGGHRYDTKHAAVNACISCHNDSHSLAYMKSPHYELWQAEVAGDAEAGTGVSCATCHLPRDKQGRNVTVQHNQNANLRPNEKMIRSVCMNCHGLQYSLDSLADPKVVDGCFRGSSDVHVKSVDMAVEWFKAKAQARKKRQEQRKKN